MGVRSIHIKFFLINSNALTFHFEERFKTKKVKTLAYYQGHSISQNPEHVGTKLAERRAFIDDAASYLSKFPTYLTHADINYQALEMQGSRYGGGHTAVAARLRGRTMTYWPIAVLVAQDETNTAD